MIWAPRVNPTKIRRLYRTARLGIYDDDLLQSVGWELYARCADIAMVADVFPEGSVPCPQCRTKVKRQINALFRKSVGNPHDSWFHCPHCAKRLLWQDCRDALRETPRCFDCGSVLQEKAARLQTAPTEERAVGAVSNKERGVGALSKRAYRAHHELHCACGKTWTWETYRRSIRTRVRLPCPHCHCVIRRPDAAGSRKGARLQSAPTGGRKKTRGQSAPTGERKKAHGQSTPTGERKEARGQNMPIGERKGARLKSAPTGERKAARGQSAPTGGIDELRCPKCNEVARHTTGYLHCTACGYKRRWRDYRKSLKKRDETLQCKACGHTFRWQAWRKSARSLRTGNPQPAREFVNKWPKCRTPQARMIQIDTLLQALHGRGALAPLFLDGNEERIRQMLDELAAQL
ncbi:hypothetical protein C6495_00155 [Candidatus Poribacteria bacterium]|nr:MAG: hypothetical protein C6495_00155 [Candidatus Poribacteria bacterium]